MPRSSSRPTGCGTVGISWTHPLGAVSRGADATLPLLHQQTYIHQPSRLLQSTQVTDNAYRPGGCASTVWRRGPKACGSHVSRLPRQRLPDNIALPYRRSQIIPRGPFRSIFDARFRVPSTSYDKSVSLLYSSIDEREWRVRDRRRNNPSGRALALSENAR